MEASVAQAVPAGRGCGPAQVIPFDCAIGAEVRGLDLAFGLSEPECTVVRGALDRHGVVVLRGQSLTPPQQIAFARALGELHPLFYSRYAGPSTASSAVSLRC
jgi:taurine dioxygenase